jgi:hypothetical protein
VLVPDSPDLAPARRRVDPSTVVIGLLVTALVAVAAGWWWSSRAEAAVFTGRDVRLMPSSLVCGDERVPFVPAEPVDEWGDVPAYLPGFVVELERADRCLLTLLVRNDGEHAVRVHDLSSYLVPEDEDNQLGLIVDRESLFEKVRGSRVNIDSTLEPGDSHAVNLPLRRAAEPCRWGESTSWMPLGTLDVSRKGQHATVRAEGDIATKVATDDFGGFCS